MITFNEWMKLQEVEKRRLSSKEEDDKFTLPRNKQRVRADAEEKAWKNSQSDDQTTTAAQQSNFPKYKNKQNMKKTMKK